ncbi:tetratricopeptide repeat protein, partial [Psychrobacter sp. AOP42-A1-21]
MFQKAANQKYSDAQFNFSVMYDNGVGIDQNYEKAIEWYLLTADNGDFDAQNNLGT